VVTDLCKFLYLREGNMNDRIITIICSIKQLKNCKMKNSKKAISCDFIFLYDSRRHRVDRVLSFFSSRPNWDSPNPSHAGECVPPLWFMGGGYYTLAWGRGGPNSDEGTDTVVL
jgi:hypothetical protein